MTYEKGKYVVSGDNGAEFVLDANKLELSDEQRNAVEKLFASGDINTLTEDEKNLISNERAVIKGEAAGDFGFARFDLKFFKID